MISRKTVGCLHVYLVALLWESILKQWSIFGSKFILRCLKNTSSISFRFLKKYICESTCKYKWIFNRSRKNLARKRKIITRNFQDNVWLLKHCYQMKLAANPRERVLRIRRIARSHVIYENLTTPPPHWFDPPPPPLIRPPPTDSPPPHWFDPPTDSTPLPPLIRPPSPTDSTPLPPLIRPPSPHWFDPPPPTDSTPPPTDSTPPPTDSTPPPPLIPTLPHWFTRPPHWFNPLPTDSPLRV